MGRLGVFSSRARQCRLPRRSVGGSRVHAAADKAAAVDELKAASKAVAAQLQSQAPGEHASQTSSPSGPATSPGDIEEIDHSNYYDRIASADAPVVVVDFYTVWCGPCKLMYPRLVQMKAELKGKVTFYKLNCNKKNKALGKELEITVAPTFLVYKGGEVVEKITGAKEEKLQAAIDAAIA